MSPSSQSSNHELSLGLFLRLTRRAHGLSLSQVTKATDKLISSQYLSMLENEKIAKPSDLFLRALATLYEIPIESLRSLPKHAPEREEAALAPAQQELDVAPQEEKELAISLSLIRKQDGSRSRYAQKMLRAETRKLEYDRR
jgi:transcriptional regulator with XRE-family HTH domain